MPECKEFYLHRKILCLEWSMTIVINMWYRQAMSLILRIAPPRPPLWRHLSKNWACSEASVSTVGCSISWHLCRMKNLQCVDIKRLLKQTSGKWTFKCTISPNGFLYVAFISLWFYMILIGLLNLLEGVFACLKLCLAFFKILYNFPA